MSMPLARITVSPATYRRVKEIVREHQFDVIHVHMLTSAALAAYCAAAAIPAFFALCRALYPAQAAGRTLWRSYRRSAEGQAEAPTPGGFADYLVEHWRLPSAWRLPQAAKKEQEGMAKRCMSFSTR